MSVISPYDEALQFIRQNPGTGGAYSLSKLILSLYNHIAGFSFAECVGNLDDRLTGVALRMVQDYAARGETDDLRAAGKIIHDDLYPRLWEMSIAMRDAREALRTKWDEEERKAELNALEAAEAALFTDPAKLVPANAAKGMLEQSDSQYAYYHRSGEWRDAKLSRDAVCAAIDIASGAELSQNCPENGQSLAVRIDERVYYVSTDYDARDAYLETSQGPRKSIPLRVSIPPRAGQQ